MSPAMHSDSFESHFGRRPASFRSRLGRRSNWFGIALLSIGILILLRALHVLPRLDLGGPLFLLAIGLVIGFRTQFRHPAWIALTLIGVFNAIPQFTIAGIRSDLLAMAAAFIIAGAYYMRRERWRAAHPRVTASPVAESTAYRSPLEEPLDEPHATSGNGRVLNTFALFGGRKEIVTAKDFSGGKVTAIFGGTELNLINADTPAQRVYLDVTAVCGGIEVIVPSHWDLVIEVDSIMGAVEDARRLRTAPADGTKTLVLRGFCLMGGVEVKSY